MYVKIAGNEKEMEDAYNIRKTVFVKEQRVPLEEEIDEFENDCTHFVLYDGEDPAGAGRFRIAGGAGKVERICILSRYRGKGAGRILMLAIEDFAQKQGVSHLKLNAQVHAIPFYEKLGYTITSGEFLDAGIPHKAMEKSI
ncbi:GNAT family N-acetyltransferase [Heyndrickxia acidiproducens]|uniref:GNAT family N-acetyltransferase n=1 Tax=Heyndrickxia acidiproducens TaxID=1121084 RepID=UPI0003695708|nr:GNAT family N-acetyltransferase [Heyndrickxia acidiproducens]